MLPTLLFIKAVLSEVDDTLAVGNDVKAQPPVMLTLGDTMVVVVPALVVPTVIARDIIFVMVDALSNPTVTVPPYDPEPRFILGDLMVVVPPKSSPIFTVLDKRFIVAFTSSPKLIVCPKILFVTVFIWFPKFTAVVTAESPRLSVPVGRIFVVVPVTSIPP